MNGRRTGTLSTNLFKFKHYNIIREQIGNLSGCSLIHFCTFKKWHSYELLLYFLSIAGPSDIIVTTFGLSEEGIRALMRAHQHGYINRLIVIINSVSRKYKNKLLFFLENIGAEIYMENVHLKLFLIENDNWNITVNQSANFSRNPTIESGVIFNDKDTYSIYFQYFKKIKNSAKKWESKSI